MILIRHFLFGCYRRIHTGENIRFYRFAAVHSLTREKTHIFVDILLIEKPSIAYKITTESIFDALHSALACHKRDFLHYWTKKATKLLSSKEMLILYTYVRYLTIESRFVRFLPPLRILYWLPKCQNSLHKRHFSVACLLSKHWAFVRRTSSIFAVVLWRGNNLLSACVSLIVCFCRFIINGIWRTLQAIWFSWRLPSKVLRQN